MHPRTALLALLLLPAAAVHAQDRRAVLDPDTGRLVAPESGANTEFATQAPTRAARRTATGYTRTPTGWYAPWPNRIEMHAIRHPDGRIELREVQP